MNDIEARAALRRALEQVAPEADLDTVGPDERFRTALELDSLDFLSLVQALHALTGVDIPESDYPKVATVRELTGYLARHTNG